jgi:hypothetical protein
VRRALVLVLWNPWVWQDLGDPQNQICSWVSVNLSHHKTNCWVCPSLFWIFIGSVLPVFLLGPTAAQPGLRPTTIPSASPCCPPPPQRLLARDEGGRWNDKIKTIPSGYLT